MPYFADVNPTEAGAAYHFTRALVENCRDDDKSTPRSNLTLPCSVYYNSSIGLKPLHPEAVNSMLLNDLGSSDAIHQDSHTGLSLIGAPSRTSILFNKGGSTLSPRFSASTFAINTTCILIRDCMPGSDSHGNGSFTCGPNFFRHSPPTWFGLTPWEDPSDLSNSDSWQNIYNWAVYAPYPSFYVEPGTGRLIVHSKSDPGEKSSVFVLKCAPSLHLITYTWANDTVTELFVSSEANSTLLNILRGPLLSNYPYNEDHLQSFAARLKIGTEDGNYTMEYYTQQYATLLSEIGLSFLGGSIESRPAHSLQIQNETVVTQLPKTALFVLICFNLWYAFIGFCLFLVAWYTIAHGDMHSDIRSVQELFTVNGLATAAVSKDRSIQSDKLRIGVEKVDDGWHFKAWDQNKDIADIDHSSTGQEPCRHPKPKACKGPALVQIDSFGSDSSQEIAADIVLGSQSTGYQNAQDLASAGGISTTSTSEGSMLGERDEMQLVFQSSIQGARSSQTSEDSFFRPTCLNRDDHSLPQLLLSAPTNVDGPSTFDDVSSMHSDV